MNPKEEKMEPSRLEVLTKFIDENRRQVEWAKNLDFKATYSCILFVLISVGWILSRENLDISQWYLQAAFWLIPLTGILILVRNHFRHFDLNEQWKRAAKALDLHQKNVYGEEAVIELRTHEKLFYIGRIQYFLPLALTALIASLMIKEYYKNQSLNQSGIQAISEIFKEIEQLPNKKFIESINQSSSNIFDIRYRENDSVKILMKFDIKNKSILTYEKL